MLKVSVLCWNMMHLCVCLSMHFSVTVCVYNFNWIVFAWARGWKCYCLLVWTNGIYMYVCVSIILLLVLITFISQQQWQLLLFQRSATSHHLRSARLVASFSQVINTFLGVFQDSIITTNNWLFSSIFNRFCGYFAIGGILTQTDDSTSSTPLIIQKDVNLYPIHFKKPPWHYTNADLRMRLFIPHLPCLQYNLYKIAFLFTTAHIT